MTAASPSKRARLGELLRATPRQYTIYAVVYFLWGLVMNALGQWMQIAAFAYWWQVVTCYVLYLVPVSLTVRRQSRAMQYVFGVLALAPLELGGYAIGSSIAYPDNVLDHIFGPRNFTLAMVMFFGIIPPVGNTLVHWIDRALARA